MTLFIETIAFMSANILAPRAEHHQRIMHTRIGDDRYLDSSICSIDTIEGK